MSEERDTVLRSSSCKSEDAEIDQSQTAAEEVNAGPPDVAANAICLNDRHQSICGALGVDPVSVSAEDLLRATLTIDAEQQLGRLLELFQSCGIFDPWFKAERQHLVRAISSEAPNTQGELELLYYSYAAQSLAMRSAARAHRGGPLAAESARNFVDLATFQLRVRDRFEAVRSCDPQNSPQHSQSPQLTADERGVETDEALIVSTPALPPPDGEAG